jgi:hypothetical protein
VVFPCLCAIRPEGHPINLDYGCTGTCIALTCASVRALLDCLNSHGKPEVKSMD